MIAKEVALLKANPQFVSLYLEGMSALFRSRVFDVMRQIGRPIIIDKGKDVQVMANQAAWSAGFNEALDIMMNFKEMFIDEPDDTVKDLRMDFGGLDYAVKRGDITQKEADDLRAGKLATSADLTA